MGNYRRP